MKSIIVFISLYLITACSSTYVVSTSHTKTSIDEFNEFALGKEAEIILNNDSTLNATSAYLTSDSLFWIDPENKLRNIKSVSEVESIHFTDGRLGGLEGAGFGAIGGGALGLVIGLINPNLDSDWGTGSTAGVYSILGAISGTLIGLTTGMIIGHTTEYKFQYEVETNNQK